MRILGLLTERQEELGLRVVHIQSHIWELRDKDEIINIYVNEPMAKQIQDDGWKYLKERQNDGNRNST